ncbi:hypothetical protein FOYG_15638 [Fusarium oxysporum NRRL 32931]|uniref:Uncharacterized protein n=1 Tax=Fusarium oxysporum NRRL 32931 TaxID=660029 RepID=W9HGM6_FUSOX|nr:hypothetical protein FOYG_15638 [Fusarium oxysporum NRRL 32931]
MLLPTRSSPLIFRLPVMVVFRRPCARNWPVMDSTRSWTSFKTSTAPRSPKSCQLCMSSSALISVKSTRLAISTTVYATTTRILPTRRVITDAAPIQTMEPSPSSSKKERQGSKLNTPSSLAFGFLFPAMQRLSLPVGAL